MKVLIHRKNVNSCMCYVESNRTSVECVLLKSIEHRVARTLMSDYY